MDDVEKRTESGSPADLWSAFVAEVHARSGLEGTPLTNLLGSVEWHRAAFMAATKEAPEREADFYMVGDRQFMFRPIADAHAEQHGGEVRPAYFGAPGREPPRLQERTIEAMGVAIAEARKIAESSAAITAAVLESLDDAAKVVPANAEGVTYNTCRCGKTHDLDVEECDACGRDLPREDPEGST